MSGCPREKINLIGMACPQNAIHAVARIEMAADGAVLEIIVEGSKPFYGVLGSIQEEGHRVIKIKNTGETWTARVKKR